VLQQVISSCYKNSN